MAGVSIKIDLNDREALDLLEEVKARALNMRPVMKAFGEHLFRTMQQRFDQEVAPDGSPWAPLAESTLEKRNRNARSHRGRGGSPKILTDKSDLRKDFAPFADADSVMLGTPLDYAAIHQFGGEAGRLDHRVNIPARPYLGVTKEDDEELNATILDHLTGGL